MSVFIYLINTRLKLRSNFLNQNNPKSKFQCKNELIYIRSRVFEPDDTLLLGFLNSAWKVKLIQSSLPKRTLHLDISDENIVYTNLTKSMCQISLLSALFQCIYFLGFFYLKKASRIKTAQELMKKTL